VSRTQNVIYNLAICVFCFDQRTSHPRPW